jgi:hypothetical protein
MMRIWGDSGMCRVNRGNSVTRLEFAFALDALRSPTIVTFLFEVRGCTQVEYNDYCSVLSATSNASDGARGTHRLVRIRRNRFPTYECLRT